MSIALMALAAIGTAIIDDLAHAVVWACLCMWFSGVALGAMAALDDRDKHEGGARR